MTDKKKSGFGSMAPEKAKLIQQAGGSASGNNFARNREAARQAGIKSGLARKKKDVNQDQE
jgi:general stress protein YciG